MALNKYQQFLKKVKQLYNSNQRMEVVELMRTFFKDYRKNDNDATNCLLELIALSDQWKKENVAEAYYILAYTNSLLGNHAIVLPNALKAIDLKLDFAYCYRLLGFTYSELKDNFKAIEFYKKAIEVDSSQVDVYNNLGNIYCNLKDYPKAIEFYKKATELDETYVHAYNNLGLVYNALKVYPEAIKYNLKAIDLDKTCVDAYNNLGISYSDLKDYSKAIENFKMAIELDETYVHAYNNLGNIYYFRKDYQKAIGYYKKAIELDKLYVNPYNNLGVTYQDTKDYSKAIEYYQKVLELDYSFLDAYYNIANVYKEENQLQNAIIFFNKYIELTNNENDIYTKLAKETVLELKRKIEETEYSEIANIIQLIKNILKFTSSCITHYTGISVGKILIIDAGIMRLSEGSFLNDTSEGRQLFDYLKWHGVIKKEKEALLEVYSEKPFIGSFVADHEHNNLTLWRMYGKEQQVEGKGCAITIDKEKFITEIKRMLGIDSTSSKKSITDESIFTFYKVAYRNNDDSFSIPGVKKSENNKLNKLLKTLKQKLELLKPEGRQEKTVELITNSLNDIAYLFKTAEYQYEHEVRLVMQGIGFEKNIDVTASFPRVYIDLANILPAITKVTIGPKVERPDEWAAAFNYSFKKKELNPAIVISRLPYK